MKWLKFIREISLYFHPSALELNSFYSTLKNFESMIIFCTVDFQSRNKIRI